MLAGFVNKLSEVLFPPPPIRCVGTYHKTGTVWMLNIFREVAERQGLKLYEFGPDARPTAIPEAPAIVFAHKCKFPKSLFNGHVRGIRIIRDPRDIVISAAHYHCRSDEAWLHIKRPYLDGKTYAQAINALKTDTEKYRFELAHTSARVIAQMVNASGKQKLDAFIEGNFLTIRYEDLIVDSDLREVEKICKFLRLPFKRVAPIFVKKSLFGAQDKSVKHIRSGQPQQWRDKFTPEFANEFAEAQQHALETLGYEADKTWVKSLCRDQVA